MIYTGTLIILLLVMVTNIMIILLLVLLLLLLTTNESNNCNNYNNNDVLIIKIIITIKMKSGWLCIKMKKRLKVTIDIIRLISYSAKKMLLNSMFVSVKVICCF